MMVIQPFTGLRDGRGLENARVSKKKTRKSGIVLP
jgi:hypothetical protein